MTGSDNTDTRVPEGVLSGIEDIQNGNTANKGDLEDILGNDKWDTDVTSLDELQQPSEEMLEFLKSVEADDEEVTFESVDDE